MLSASSPVKLGGTEGIFQVFTLCYSDKWVPGEGWGRGRVGSLKSLCSEAEIVAYHVFKGKGDGGERCSHVLFNVCLYIYFLSPL